MKQRTEEDGRRLVAAYKASGLTARQYSEEAGITLWSLYYWVARVRELEAAGSGSPRFVEVSRKSVAGSAMSIQAGIVQVSFAVLPGAAWLSEFVTALNGR